MIMLTALSTKRPDHGQLDTIFDHKPDLTEEQAMTKTKIRMNQD